MDQFDPYHSWLGIPPRHQPPNHYRLLGLQPLETDQDVIANAAGRQMAHLRTYQTGQHSALSQEILNEIAKAKVCLLHPEKKADYDRRLRQEMQARSGPPAKTNKPRVARARPLETPVKPAPKPAPPVGPRRRFSGNSKGRPAAMARAARVFRSNLSN